MRISIILVLILSALSCQNDTEAYDMAIADITIIDVKNSRLLPNKTIYIEDGRIRKITSEKVSKNIVTNTFINGKGKYIVSGFWDMHVHSCWKEGLDESILPTFLRYGITGIRDMGGNLDVLNTFKEIAKKRPSSYPNLYGAGPILDGETPIHPAFSVPVSTDNFRQVLDSLVNKKVDFFKVYSLLKKDVVDSIANYSKDHHIDFSGHISEYISPEHASALQQKSFEHLNRLEDLANHPIRLDEFIELVKKNENWVCPTLIIYQRKFEAIKGEFLYHPLYDSLDIDLKNEWDQSKSSNTVKNQTEIEQASLRWTHQKQLVKMLYDKGIPMLLGTDFAGMPFVYQGYSLHEEMQLFEDIGITTFDILKIATLNPTVYLGIENEYGTVEVDKIADLVIFDKNPIEKIEHTLSISKVIKSGKIVK